MVVVGVDSATALAVGAAAGAVCKVKAISISKGERVIDGSKGCLEEGPNITRPECDNNVTRYTGALTLIATLQPALITALNRR